MKQTKPKAIISSMRDALKEMPFISPRVDYGRVCRGVVRRSVDEMFNDVIDPSSAHRYTAMPYQIANFGGDEGSAFLFISERDLRESSFVWLSVIFPPYAHKTISSFLLGFSPSIPTIDGPGVITIPPLEEYEYIQLQSDQALLIDLAEMRRVKAELEPSYPPGELNHLSAYGTCYTRLSDIPPRAGFPDCAGLFYIY